MDTFLKLPHRGRKSPCFPFTQREKKRRMREEEEVGLSSFPIS